MRKRVLKFVAAACAAGLVSQAIGANVVHRWSFTSGPDQLKDSIVLSGAADITLVNTATITANQLDLTANTGKSTDYFAEGYATIPAGQTTDGLTSATVEGWLTWGGTDAPFVQNWQTAWSFGKLSAPNNYIALLTDDSPHHQAGVDSGKSGTDVTEPLLGVPFPTATEVHFAVVYKDGDAAPMQLFTNIAGHTFVSALPTNGFTLSGMGATVENFLGRDFFPSDDVLWKGSINELRIWDAAFDQAAFDAAGTAGPDVLPAAGPGEWAIDGGGTWGDTNSWTDHVIPAGAGTGHANFLGKLVNNNGTVTLDGARAVAGLTFNNAAHQYTIAQGSSGALTLGDGTVTATIDVNAGTHIISAPVNLNSNTTITVATSSTLNMTGVVVVAASKDISKAGPGTASIGGLEGTAGNIDQTAGLLNLSVDSGKTLSAKRVRLNNLTLAATSNLILSQTTGGTATTSKVATLTMDPTATLDIKDNSMVISTGTLSTIRTLVLGGKIKTTSTVTSPGGTGKATTVGYASGAQVPNLGNVLEGQSFSAGSVLLKYTYLGDANLDGSVDPDDVAIWATNFTGAGSFTKSWAEGDWTGDGAVDPDDVAKWATNFTGALAGNALGGGISSAAAPAAVPEPGGLLLMCLTATWMARRVEDRGQRTRAFKSRI